MAPSSCSAVEGRIVVARQQDEQGGGIGLDRVGDRPNRLLPLLERAARIDGGDRGARGDEARLGIVGTARGDRLPAGALGKPGQLVAMAKGEDEQRRRHPHGGDRGARQSELGPPSRLGTLTWPLPALASL